MSIPRTGFDHLWNSKSMSAKYRGVWMTTSKNSQGDSSPKDISRVSVTVCSLVASNSL
jgi:hypothetical protein